MGDDEICSTCGRGLGLNPDDSLAPPVDLSRCLCPDGLECRAVAQAKTFMRFDQQDAARDLLDAIATPPGRDFARAWDNATLMYGRYGQPPTMIDRWRDVVRDREAEVLKCEAELDEARTLLDRIVRYHGEDRAVTPGCTRLARVIAEAKAWIRPASTLADKSCNGNHMDAYDGRELEDRPPPWQIDTEAEDV